MEERSVAFVGFGNQKGTTPQLRVRSDAVQTPANDKRGVQPGFRQHAGGQTRGRGFAMGTRYGYPVAKPHEFREHFRPGYHRDFPGYRGVKLWIGGLDGRGHHHDLGTLDVGGGMSLKNACAQSLQATGSRVVSRI